MDMDIDVQEKLANLYIKLEIKHEKLSDVDKDVIDKAILNTLIDSNIKYEIYLDNMKHEAFRVLELFQKWYNNADNSLTMKEYEEFYNNYMKNTFVYNVYKIIYIFFHPVVISNNFISTETESEISTSKQTICNDEFIINIFHLCFYYNVLNYDDFKKQEVNWDEKYLVPSNYILGKQIYTCYDQMTNNYIPNFQMNIYEMNSLKNDPRWLLS